MTDEADSGRPATTHQVTLQAAYQCDEQGIVDNITSERNRLNKNNVTRTQAYLDFFLRNPEIPWSLLAHLVSRSAGYNMTDLERYRIWRRLAQVVSEVATTIAVIIELVVPNMELFFRFLERPNFLIFYDAFPQLKAYEWSKRCPALATQVFQLLPDRFGVARIMAEKWINFFDAARRNNFYSNTPNIMNNSEIDNMTLALIANEQNLIQNRVVHNSHYTSGPGVDVDTFIGALGTLGWNRLCFSYPQRPNRMRVYRVMDFRSLDERISTGKSLYDGLLKDSVGVNVLAFARGRRHTGSRTDYNQNNYSTNPLTVMPGGKKYSPTLIPIWGDDATTVQQFSDLHDDPEPDPRGDFSSDIQRFLNQLPIGHGSFLQPDPTIGAMQEVAI